MSTTPVLTRDPRFVAGRKLVGEEGAVEIFGSLLESARIKYGNDHIEAAPGYYEYGNALLRRKQRLLNNNNDDNPRELAALAAEARRSKQQQQQPPPPVVSSNPAGTTTDNTPPSTTTTTTNMVDEDLMLALEMMENAFSIMDQHMDNEHHHHRGLFLYGEWVQAQMPRVLTGLGDGLLALNRPADATDAYLRALAYRNDEAKAAALDDVSIVALTKRRSVVEANILIVEALIMAPFDQDLVTSETKNILVKGGSVLDYAKGYYDKARDELQETLLLMGQLAAQGIDLGTEKQNVCHVATMVMGAGNALAEIEERHEEMDSKEPAKKKVKSHNGT